MHQLTVKIIQAVLSLLASLLVFIAMMNISMFIRVDPKGGASAQAAMATVFTVAAVGVFLAVCCCAITMFHGSYIVDRARHMDQLSRGYAPGPPTQLAHGDELE